MERLEGLALLTVPPKTHITAVQHALDQTPAPGKYDKTDSVLSLDTVTVWSLGTAVTTLPRLSPAMWTAAEAPCAFLQGATPE
eukprot:3712374-Rhodomonas_salina.1